jgi:hypothetical protein
MSFLDRERREMRERLRQHSISKPTNGQERVALTPRGFAEWLAAMDAPDSAGRRTVTLNEIIKAANEALTDTADSAVRKGTSFYVKAGTMCFFGPNLAAKPLAEGMLVVPETGPVAACGEPPRMWSVPASGVRVGDVIVVQAIPLQSEKVIKVMTKSGIVILDLQGGGARNLQPDNLVLRLGDDVEHEALTTQLYEGLHVQSFLTTTDAKWVDAGNGVKAVFRGCVRAALAAREEPREVDDREWTLTQDFEHPSFGVADGPSLGVDERITVVPKSHVPAREDTERPRAARTSDDDLADLQACAQEVRDAFAGEDTERQGEEVDALPNQDNQGLREAANGVLDHYYHRRAKSLLQDRTLQAAMQRLHRAVAAPSRDMSPVVRDTEQEHVEPVE